MKRTTVLACLAAICITANLGAVERLVLAVPAQHAMVNLAFDLADCLPRDLEMVCYSFDGDGKIKLEAFDRLSWRWVDLPSGAWAGGALPRSGASRLVAVGDGAASLVQTASWARGVRQVDGRRLHEVANAVSSERRLSPAQWNMLAARHGFKLEDRNAERRRYGRYGPPATKEGWQPATTLPLELPIVQEPVQPITVNEPTIRMTNLLPAAPVEAVIEPPAAPVTVPAVPATNLPENPAPEDK